MDDEDLKKPLNISLIANIMLEEKNLSFNELRVKKQIDKELVENVLDSLKQYPRHFELKSMDLGRFYSITDTVKKIKFNCELHVDINVDDVVFSNVEWWEIIITGATALGDFKSSCCCLSRDASHKLFNEFHYIVIRPALEHIMMPKDIEEAYNGKTDDGYWFPDSLAEHKKLQDENPSVQQAWKDYLTIYCLAYSGDKNDSSN